MDFGAILVSKLDMARANTVFARINAFSSLNAPRFHETYWTAKKEINDS